MIRSARDDQTTTTMTTAGGGGGEDDDDRTLSLLAQQRETGSAERTELLDLDDLSVRDDFSLMSTVGYCSSCLDWRFKLKLGPRRPPISYPRDPRFSEVLRPQIPGVSRFF